MSGKQPQIRVLIVGSPADQLADCLFPNKRPCKKTDLAFARGPSIHPLPDFLQPPKKVSASSSAPLGRRGGGGHARRRSVLAVDPELAPPESPPATVVFSYHVVPFATPEEADDDAMVKKVLSVANVVLWSYDCGDKKCVRDFRDGWGDCLAAERERRSEVMGAGLDSVEDDWLPIILVGTSEEVMVESVEHLGLADAMDAADDGADADGLVLVSCARDKELPAESRGVKLLLDTICDVHKSKTNYLPLRKGADVALEDIETVVEKVVAEEDKKHRKKHPRGIMAVSAASQVVSRVVPIAAGIGKKTHFALIREDVLKEEQRSQSGLDADEAELVDLPEVLVDSRRFYWNLILKSWEKIHSDRLKVWGI